MKINYIYTLFLCWGLIVFNACDDRLNVVPQQSIDESQALSTAQNVKAALNGAYDGMQDDDVFGGLQFLHELFADDGDQIWAGTFEEPEQVFQKRILVQNLQVEDYWTESYEAINRANNVLSALDKLDPEDLGTVEGGARFIRGAIYYDLVSMFAKSWLEGDPSSNLGVPLIIQPTRTIDEESNVARNSVAEVYTLVLDDLIKARDMLPEDNGIFASTYAASGMLSRIYLSQEKFAEALTEANRIIESGQFSLVENYADVFNQSSNTSEDIFAIQITSQDPANTVTGTSNNLNLFYAPDEFGGRGDIDITDQHLSRYEDGDARRDLFFIDGNGIPRTGKWLNTVDGNVNILRLAEMYLTRSECRFRLGETTGAAEDLNVVRARVGLPPIAEADLTLDVILNERNLELIFEGHMFRDKKRNRISIGDLSFDSEKLVYPIPQREMDSNPNLVQNPGY